MRRKEGKESDDGGEEGGHGIALAPITNGSTLKEHGRPSVVMYVQFGKVTQCNGILPDKPPDSVTGWRKQLEES